MTERRPIVTILAVVQDQGFSDTEPLSATSLGDELFRLERPPLSCYDLNVGDVVRATPDRRVHATTPVVIERVLDGGHRTLRVFFADGIPLDQQIELIDHLRLVSSVDAVHGWDRFWSLDVPSDPQEYEVVCDQLHAWELAGLLGYETGATNDD